MFGALEPLFFQPRYKCCTISESWDKMPLDSTKKWAKKSLHKLLRASQKEVKKNSKIRIRTDMIFLIMVLGRHLVMYWAPENKSFKWALEVLKKWKKVFFSESSPQFFFHIWYPGCRILLSLQNMAGIGILVPNRVHM